MDDLLPVLDVTVPEGPELLSLLKCAVNGETARVALDIPPEDDGNYALEVHVAGSEKTFLFVAHRVGPGDEGRVPMRVSLASEEEVANAMQAIFALERVWSPAKADASSATTGSVLEPSMQQPDEAPEASRDRLQSLASILEPEEPREPGRDRLQPLASMLEPEEPREPVRERPESLASLLERKEPREPVRDRLQSLASILEPDEPGESSGSLSSVPEPVESEPPGPHLSEAKAATVESHGVVAPAPQAAERVAPPTEEPSAEQGTLAASSEEVDNPVPSGRVSEVLVGRGLADGKYVVLSRLGEGAVGAVYKAHHRDLDKVVAVKVLHSSYRRDPEFATRFHGEALAASKLDHGNVVRVLDFGQEPDGLLYLVMEFLAGRELAAMLEREGIPELPRVVSIASQICAALAIAHEAGFAHRDIKPANVMLIDGQDDEGQPMEIAKVSDFGLAAEIQDANTDERTIICGTPAYMSPEQCQGKVVDGRTDIYSLGVMLYEMATGMLPFTDRSVHEVLRRQQEETPTPPSEVWPDTDPRLERIILKAIAKAPEDRYQTARELRAELRRLVERRQERREVFDLTQLAALSDEAAGFAPFFVTFASAILRMGYYERGHAQFGFPIARLAEAAKKTLAHRGELTFIRQLLHGEVVITVVSGAGDAANLNQLVPQAVATLYAEKFADAFVRRHVVSLTLRDGVEAAELEDLAELLSGPEVEPSKVRERLDQLRLPNIDLLFAEEMLGRSRRLPWQVDLCISRVARDLRALPLLRQADPETMRALRLQIVGDVLRPLSRPEQLRILLEHADLIASHIESIPELQGLDVTDTILASLSPRMRASLGRVLLDCITGKTPSVAGATPRRAPKELLFALANHLSQGLVPEGEALLRELHDRAVLRLDQLPREVQIGIKAEETAKQIAAQGEAYLQRFDLVQDLKAYNHFAPLFERAMRYLVQRARARDVRMTLSRFEQHTSDPARIQGIRQRAAAAIASLDNLDITTVLSHIYLTGDPDERDDARAVLLKYPRNAAAGLCAARAEFSGKESALRARFVGAMRDIGPGNWPVLGEKIRAIDDDADETWIDDILRSVPNVCDEAAGERVAALAKHPSPSVRRSASRALASLWGARARDALLAILAGTDDGARLGAISGLRTISAIDRDVVMRLDRILSGLATASEEVQAAAAAALADTLPEAAGTARGVLARRVLPPSKSLLNVVRGAMASREGDSHIVILASVRSLLSLGGSQGMDVIARRVASSSGALRDELEALIRSAQRSRDISQPGKPKAP